ncbi:MAG: DNA-directed DNA polymerase [Candidatus Micrarchaeia archaeon]|jgi:DNA polymerase I
MERAFLLDAESVSKSRRSAIRLFLKDEKTGKAYPEYFDFLPYFLVIPKVEVTGDFGSEKMEEFKKGLFSQKFSFRGKDAKITAVETVEKLVALKPTKLLKVIVDHPRNVSFLSDELKQFGTVYENNIPFHYRFMIDSGLKPNALVEYEESEDGFVRNAKKAHAESFPALRTLAIDIEAFSSTGALPEPARDPCIMVSFADKDNAGVITFKHAVNAEGVENAADEKAMLERFSKVIAEHHADLLCTYNGDAFDLPFLQKRADVTGAAFKLGRTKKAVFAKKIGMRTKTYVQGRIHFDVYHAITFLNTVGAIKLSRLTLDDAYFELFGKHKVDLKYDQIWENWKTGKGMDKVAEYAKVDSIACLDLANYCLDLELALSRQVGLPMFESSRATAGQLVEFYLMRKSFEYGEIVPNKPSYSEVVARSENPLQGAFVKTPEPGVYENIAVLDFRSLYPSIIVSHNIDPSTKDCTCCTDEETKAATGHHYCKKRKGLVPRVLEEVLESRFAIKRKLSDIKKAGGADTQEYKQLNATQWALKVIANSFYGYLAYPRSRWYDFDCGSAITGLARNYIKATMDAAEASGYKVLYGDTDSLMIQYPKGGEDEVFEFRARVNKKLPGNMELELEEFFVRGLFVSKKATGAKDEKAAGAKKKYAMITKEGKIKIRGFELVRRDWSGVAKRTQKELLRILLETGDVKAAADMVMKVVTQLKSGNVPLDDLTILTQLRKKAGSYAIMSPELNAAQKARAAGIRLPDNAIIGYVIGKKGKSISEKAVLREMAIDYDPDYYINNQVIPATLKLLSAFGYDEDSLKSKGTQSKLGDW